MSTVDKHFFKLTAPCCLEIAGQDSVQVVNNLCTNDVTKLSEGEALEAFITNVRGWVVAHVRIYRTKDGVILLTHDVESQALSDHIDRYIIREDATIRSLACDIWVFDTDVAPEFDSQHPDLDQSISLSARFAGGRSLICASTQASAHLEDTFQNAGWLPWEESHFRIAQLLQLWPTQGREILDKTLPQELDRDQNTISFTKGCYLGQETIARLDALGQLQKKLCVLEIEGSSVAEGATLHLGDQEVGKLTTVGDVSSDNDPPCTIALAYIRRGSFDVGTQLTCGGHPAVVVQPQ